MKKEEITINIPADKSVVDPLVQIAFAMDALAFAVAAQSSINAPRFAKQLKRLARGVKKKNELAKVLLEKMAETAGSVAKKRGRRARGVSFRKA